MRRRKFITLLGGAVAAWSPAARAQQRAMPVVGFLGTGSPQSDAFRVAAVRQGLIEAGYVEGRNVAFEYRGAEDHYERLPALAAELVRREVAVIASIGGITSALAAKAATATIPIVFQIGGDPIKLGLVASLSRPDGNITGVTWLAGTLTAKLFEVLHETVPKAALIGYLVNPTNAEAEIQTKNARATAEMLGQKLLVVQARTGSETDGGLISYGPDFVDQFRQAASYVDRILKGEKPADLPVQNPAKFELVINLKTAKSLGLSVSPSLLARANEIIE
jgi:putative ABC transport system substrate-binding protein